MHRRSLLFMAPLVLGLALAGLWPTQAADSTDTVTFQCRLVQNGVPLNGTVKLGFTIWDNATDPVSGSAPNNIAWLHTESQTVVVVNGLMSVRLGEQTGNPLGDLFFASASTSRERYVMVHIDPDVESQTSPAPPWPRLLAAPVKLSAVPYSLDANVAARLWDAGSSATKTVAELTADYDGRYVQSGGVGASQTIYGGLDPNANLILQSTANGTRGTIILQDAVDLQGNADLAGTLKVAEVIEFANQTAAPSTVTNNHVAVYARNNKLYFLPQGGSETEVGAGAGSGAPASLLGGRLTVSNSEAVTTTNLNNTFLYYLPYTSSEVALWENSTSSWKTVSIGAGISISNASSDLDGGSIVQDRNYDVYLFDSGGTPTLGLMGWQVGSTTTRQTNKEPERDPSDGVYVLEGDKTKRYLGTVRTILDSAVVKFTDMINRRFVWNLANRVPTEAGWSGGWFTTINTTVASGSATSTDLLVGLTSLLNAKVTVQHTSNYVANVQVRVYLNVDGVSSFGTTSALGWDASNGYAINEFSTARYSHYATPGVSNFQVAADTHGTNNSATNWAGLNIFYER